MATRTVSQSGPLSSAATFGGSAFSNGDDILNPAGNNFTLTVDTNATVAGFGGTGGNGATVVNGGVTLTLTGNVVQGNKSFTLNAGATLTFDCTAADRKFLFGDVASYSAYTSCIFVANGSSGSHCVVNKTGGNYCWFDCFSENSGGGSDKTGYDCTYTDFTGIGTSGGGFSLGVNTFGNNPIKLSHCTFDGCGTVLFNRPYGWGGGNNKDYSVTDCRFTNSVAYYSCRIVADGNSGSGLHAVRRNVFDATVYLNASVDLTDNLFERGIEAVGGALLACTGNLYLRSDGGPEITLTAALTRDCYYMAGPDSTVANPHCFNSPPAGSTVSYNIFEFPYAQAIDSGEAVYGNNDGVVVEYNLVVPSETDGKALGNVAHNSGATAQWTVRHNTVVGESTAYIAYTESGSDRATPQYAVVKSNLVVDPVGSTACVVFDVFLTNTDVVDPANSTHNGIYGPQPYADPVSGLTLTGYRAKFTARPGDGTDIVSNPQFVDSTRNFSRWAVHKGAAASGDPLLTRMNATIALLRADPSLIATDLIPWVRAGFAPRNKIYRNAGHDGVTVGAVEGQWPAATLGLLGIG